MLSDFIVESRVHLDIAQTNNVWQIIGWDVDE